MNNHLKLVAERADRLRSMGKCTNCGKRPIYKASKNHCRVCLDKKKLKQSIYRQGRSKEIYESQKRCIAKNPEKYRGIKKKFWEKNKPEWARYAEERRARKLNAKGTFSVREWKDLLNKYGNKCLKCGSTKRLEADHVIPLSRGGSNSIENIQPLCRTCNSSKSTKIIDFRPFGNIILDWT